MGVQHGTANRGSRHAAGLLLSFLLVLAALACGLSIPVDPAVLFLGVTPTYTPFQPVPPTPTPLPPTLTPTPTITPTPTGTSLWIEPGLPPVFKQGVSLPPGYFVVEQPEQALLRLVVGSERPVSRWVYALTAPFPTLVQGVSQEDVRRCWRGEQTGAFAGRPLLMDESTQAVFTALWGAPADGAVRVLSSDALLTEAWNQQPSWAIVPFEALEPRWKVLEVDGQSPLRKAFDPAVYALSVPVSLVGKASLVDAAAADAAVAEYGPGTAAPLASATNRDPQKLTTVALTGVTALVRATAFTMEQRGILYPGRSVRDWLREADITHISNEVPFARDCPFPDPVQSSMRFCSDPRYIELLEDVGTDIVELTGDHFQDWGNEAMLYTLELYRQRGWPYYGGGENLEDARKALIVEHNGNRLAFIGCNGKGGGFAQAAPGHPGAVVCDYDWMQAEIRRLRSEGYLPIATFQHFENYIYHATAIQKRDFQGVAEAGAVIVSGSQAHQPQAFEFVGDSLIHYGLGNMFFDQYDVSRACRQAFIDRHVFYGGHYIGVDLLTIQFVDYARPRPMTPDEQGDLLDTVFTASGW